MSDINTTMAIDIYEVHEAEAREISFMAYTTDSYFPVLESKARTLGFRHATIGEIHASANRKSHSDPDLYCWAGGLWVRLGEDVK